MRVTKRLKVAIDFRVEDPRQGVGTAVLALAHGLSRLKENEQEYVFVVPEHIVEWIKPHLNGPCSVVAIPAPKPTLRSTVRAKLAGIPALRKLWLNARKSNALTPSSDGTIERLACDVVHFPSQIAYLTEVPSIYQPWDLQHCHLPQFFSEEDLILRSTYYPAFCRQARFVCVQTEWGKQDLITQYGLEAEKISVIRWGTAFEAYSASTDQELAEIRRQLGLPDTFLVYPAVAWPHKNHELILRGLALLQQRTGKAIDVVFTGKPTQADAELQTLAKSLGIEQYLHFLGFVSTSQIQAIFQGALAMIFPSRFEGLGLPVLEAFRVGLPVICSSATVLPEVSGGAALLFDPDSPEEMVAALERLCNTPSLRAELIGEGYSVLKRYSADTAAEQFVRLYRKTAGRSEEQS
jgi:glycosyltransferase involved in cell wall biosynthesis